MEPAAIERLHRLGGDRLVARMLGIFFDHAPARIDAARVGARAGVPQEAERAAHSLRSSCGQVGAVAMAALCGRIEALAAEGSLDPVPGLLDELQQELERFTEWARRNVPAARPAT